MASRGWKLYACLQKVPTNQHYCSAEGPKPLTTYGNNIILSISHSFPRGRKHTHIYTHPFTYEHTPCTLRNRHMHACMSIHTHAHSHAPSLTHLPEFPISRPRLFLLFCKTALLSFHGSCFPWLPLLWHLPGLPAAHGRSHEGVARGLGWA